MENKKISFSFIKSKKINKPKIEEKEYIESIENQTINVLSPDNKKERLPIVIPMKPNIQRVATEDNNKTLENVEKKAKDVTKHNLDTDSNRFIQKNETLEQMADRELIEEARKEIKTESKPELTVPISNTFKAGGAQESSLEDYEIIPIQEFGMAMLRGMGWNPNRQTPKLKMTELRPKGLGLGADKVSHINMRKKEEELTITKNSFVKVTTGRHSGFYGKVISVNEKTGRVIVELILKNEIVSFSEFMLQAVTESEYDNESKVLNNK